MILNFINPSFGFKAFFIEIKLHRLTWYQIWDHLPQNWSPFLAWGVAASMKTKILEIILNQTCLFHLKPLLPPSERIFIVNLNSSQILNFSSMFQELRQSTFWIAPPIASPLVPHLNQGSIKDLQSENFCRIFSFCYFDASLITGGWTSFLSLPPHLRRWLLYKVSWPPGVCFLLPNPLSFLSKTFHCSESIFIIESFFSVLNRSVNLSIIRDSDRLELKTISQMFLAY